MNQFDSIHSDDLGEVVGQFFGNDIRLWDANKSDERHARHLNACVAAGRSK